MTGSRPPAIERAGALHGGTCRTGPGGQGRRTTFDLTGPEWARLTELLTADDFGQPLAVITGGWSRERDRSLLSGHAVMGSLARQGIEAIRLDLDAGPKDLLAGLGGVGLAFLAIAGRGGEDGRLQGLLETLRIDYTGSGVRACALGMHKPLAKTAVAAAGVSVPAGTVVDSVGGVELEVERIGHLFGWPVIVKPVGEGGSIGLRVATGPSELAEALRCREAGGELMVERFHPGRPVSVGVLEDQQGACCVLPTLETEAPGGVYTYEAKRGQAECVYHCPARVSAAVQEVLRRQAVAAHRALGCHSYSRHDFVVTGDGSVLWLEVNTLPGLSEAGNLARMAAGAGLTYDQLVAHIVRGARVDRRAQP